MPILLRHRGIHHCQPDKVRRTYRQSRRNQRDRQVLRKEPWDCDGWRYGIDCDIIHWQCRAGCANESDELLEVSAQPSQPILLLMGPGLEL